MAQLKVVARLKIHPGKLNEFKSLDQELLDASQGLDVTIYSKL